MSGPQETRRRFSCSTYSFFCSPALFFRPVAEKIGARGFEPPTSRSRTVRSSQTELRPVSVVSSVSTIGGILSIPSVPGADPETRPRFRSELGAGSSGILRARGVPLQGRLNGGHVLVPVALERREIRAEGAAEGGQRAVAGRELRERRIGASQQVKKGQELRKVLGAKIVNQRPGLGVKITPVTVAVTRVADQRLQGGAG